MLKSVFGSKEKDNPNQRKVLVLSADRVAGKVIVAALAQRQMLKVYAGVAHPDKYGAPCRNVEVIKTDMDNPKAIKKVFKTYRFDRVVLVVPDNRPDWAENALEAADQCKSVKFAVVLSALTAPLRETFFGVNYSDVEHYAREIFPFAYCIVRVPLFLDHLFYMNGRSVAEDGIVRDPRDPDMPFSAIAMSDLAKAVTELITHPSQHEQKVYKLVAPPITVNHQVQALQKVLKNKNIKVQVDDYQDYCMYMREQAGFPDWQIDGIMEVYELIDNGSDVTNELKQIRDFEKITKTKPMTLEQWCQANAGKFQLK